MHHHGDPHDWPRVRHHTGGKTITDDLGCAPDTKEVISSLSLVAIILYQVHGHGSGDAHEREESKEDGNVAGPKVFSDNHLPECNLLNRPSGGLRSKFH